MFLRNITIFLENIKVFFAAWECVKTKPRPYEPKDSIVHVLTYPPDEMIIIFSFICFPKELFYSAVSKWILRLPSSSSSI